MNYLLRRLAATLPVMAVVAVVVFLLIHLSPGDPAALIAGDLATTDDIDRLRVALGLDKPLPVQFVGWLGRILSGDLGTSIFTQVPVTQLLAQRLEPTLSIAVLTMTLAVLLSVPLAAVVVTLVDVVIRNKNPAEEETPAVLFPAAKEAGAD